MMLDKTKSIIFLDIDGVLSTDREYYTITKNFWGKHRYAKKLKIKYPFNPKCINVFNNILAEVDCEIVLTSDWRKHYRLEEIDLIFRFNGVVKSPVDYTTIFYGGHWDSLSRIRASEIEIYIRDHDIKKYVIIDDLELQYFFTDKFVKTTDLEGIKQSGVKDKILNFLRDEPEEKEETGFSGMGH